MIILLSVCVWGGGELSCLIWKIQLTRVICIDQFSRHLFCFISFPVSCLAADAQSGNFNLRQERDSSVQPRLMSAALLLWRWNFTGEISKLSTGSKRYPKYFPDIVKVTAGAALRSVLLSGAACGRIPICSSFPFPCSSLHSATWKAEEFLRRPMLAFRAIKIWVILLLPLFMVYEQF